MSQGFADWTDIGIFPGQDIESGVEIGTRMTLAMARVEKRGDPGENAGVTTFARERNMGTLGDVHPWFFWQTKEREKRAMGSWSMAWAAMAIDEGERFHPLIVKGGDFQNDIRYAQADPTWPECLPTNPMGTLGLVMPSTNEQEPDKLFVRADPRLVAPNTSGPGDAGTLVVDCQPGGELCMDGGATPGRGGRMARLQSVFRVIALNANSVGPLGAGDYNGIAINYALSQQDGILGYGAIYSKMPTGGTTGSGGGGGGPITQEPGRNSSYKGPGDVVARLGLGESGGPDGGPELEGGGASDDEKTACDFGSFRAQPRDGHGIALMASVGACGPIHPGADGCQHSFGTDADGHPIRAAHLDTNAYFFESAAKDGPLMFEGDWPDDVEGFPLKAFVHLDFDKDSPHNWCGGPASGKWRWWAEVPYVPPTQGPITPVTTTPVTTTPVTTTPVVTTPVVTIPPIKTPKNGPVRPGPTIPPIKLPQGGGPIRPGPAPGRSGGTVIQPGSGRVIPGRGGDVLDPQGFGQGGIGESADPGGRGAGGPPPPVPDGLGTGDIFAGQSQIIPFQGPAEGSRGPGAGGTEYFQNEFDLGIMSGGGSREGRPSGRNPGVIERVGQTNPEDVGNYSIFHPMSEGFAAISFRPQLWIKGVPNFEHNPEVPSTVIRRDERVRPTVLTLRPWGKQSSSGDWGYHEAPQIARSRGGSVDGGVLFAPPHLEMEDYFGIGANASTTTEESKSFVALAPCVCFAFGQPNTAGGMQNDAIIQRVDPNDATGAYSLEQIDSSGVSQILLTASLVNTSEKFVDIKGTTSMRVPTGTTAQRPGTPVNGEMRINTTDEALEFVDTGGFWVQLTGGAGATTWVGLTDTPGGFTALKIPTVNSGGTALEFSGLAVTATGALDGNAKKATNFAGASAAGDLVELVQAVAVFMPFTGGTFTGDVTWSGGKAKVNDNINVVFGTGDDATIDYDGTNLVIDPKVVGSGHVEIPGSLEVADGFATAGTSRNAHLTVFSDNAFGMELSGISAAPCLLLYGRSTDTDSIKFGTYTANSTAQNDFSQLAVLTAAGGFGVGVTTPAAGKVDASGGFADNGTAGIDKTFNFNDEVGDNHSVIISGGIITQWDIT